MTDVAMPERLRRRAFLALFVGACVAGFAALWVNTGGAVPSWFEGDPYRISFVTDDIKSLENFGEVRVAGVEVGHVESRVEQAGGAVVTVRLEDDVAPLHEGATARVGLKSVLGQSYVELVDGDGSELPNGSQLPTDAVHAAVDIDELLDTLDDDTRGALSSSLQSLGEATDGTADDVGRLVAGLGHLGREGLTAVDAIAEQSDDLAELTRETTTLLAALDTGRGRIADVVRDADRLTQATSDQREAIEQTVKGLPGLMTEARSATDSLAELSDDLGPVAADLDAAGPALSSALEELPATTRDLRGLLPPLQGVLDRAPATLTGVPQLDRDVRTLFPEVHEALRDVNPMLDYLAPYGTDVGVFFANFGASFDRMEPNGVRPVRLQPIFNNVSVRNYPTELIVEPYYYLNPFPGAGDHDTASPFRGEYPRVERDPR